MADTRQSTIVGVFSSRAKADRAIAALQKAGFQNDQIRFSSERRTHDDVIRDLVDMGVSPEDIRFYQREYEEGHPLVSVTSGKRMQDATSIMLSQGAYGPQEKAGHATYTQQTGTRAGATGMAAQPETRTGSASMAQPETRAGSAGMAQKETARVLGEDEVVTEQYGKGLPQHPQHEQHLQQEQHMLLHAEQLRAYKKPSQVGEVILRKEVVTEQQSIDVPIVHEEIVIERRTLAEDASASEEPLGTDQTIRIPVNEEQVNVAKQTMTVGEVVIGKRETQETRHFSDTVQREEARLERKGDIPVWDTNIDQPPMQRGV